MDRGLIIALEGGISVGKSTLGRSLEDRGHFLGRPIVFFKEYDNPMLPLYLKDQQRYAFPFQSVAMKERLNTHREAERLVNEGKCVVIDRGIPGDLAFALMQKDRGFFTEEEWMVYWKYVLEHRDTKWKPDLVVYLECSPEQAFDRLKTRGNQDEINSYTLEYFQQLMASHEQAFKIYDEVTSQASPILRIDWSKSEPIRNGRSSSPDKLNISVDGVLPESSLDKFEKMLMTQLNIPSSDQRLIKSTGDEPIISIEEFRSRFGQLNPTSSRVDRLTLAQPN